jgi:hypothetical protein
MQSSESDRQKYFGSLEVKVLETREIDINFVTVKVENTPKLSEVKKHHSSSHQFSDVLHFNIGRPEADISIQTWRKNIIMKDKEKGRLTILVSTLLDEQVHTGWYPFEKPPKQKGDKSAPAPATATAPTSATPAPASAPAEGGGEGSTETGEAVGRKRAPSLATGSSKKRPTGEIRLELKFTKNAPPKEILTGIILNDQWTSETSGGALVNNRKWVKNPQFLLSVDNPSDVTIKLRQPEDSTQRVSFYVLHYDGFYNGRRKVVLDT